MTAGVSWIYFFPPASWAIVEPGVGSTYISPPTNRVVTGPFNNDAGEICPTPVMFSLTVPYLDEKLNGPATVRLSDVKVTGMPLNLALMFFPATDMDTSALPLLRVADGLRSIFCSGVSAVVVVVLEARVVVGLDLELEHADSPAVIANIPAPRITLFNCMVGISSFS